MEKIEKSVSCGLCSSDNTALIKMNNDNQTKFTGDNVYQCYKCGNRFGVTKF